MSHYRWIGWITCTLFAALAVYVAFDDPNH